MDPKNLDSLEPRNALEMWIGRQRADKSDDTVQSYFYRVRKFVDWLDDQGADNLHRTSIKISPENQVKLDISENQILDNTD